jgi:hypothetical protein
MQAQSTTEQAISEAFYAAGVVVPVDAISLRSWPDRVSVLLVVSTEEVLRLMQYVLQDANIGGHPITLRSKPHHRAGQPRTAPK